MDGVVSNVNVDLPITVSISMKNLVNEDTSSGNVEGSFLVYKSYNTNICTRNCIKLGIFGEK